MKRCLYVLFAAAVGLRALKAADWPRPPAPNVGAVAGEAVVEQNRAHVASPLRVHPRR